MKKNLWVKLISVILIAASMVTMVACDSEEDESGNYKSRGLDSQRKSYIYTYFRQKGLSA